MLDQEAAEPLERPLAFPPQPTGHFAMSAPRTLYDKIWDDLLVQNNADGTSLIYIDRHLVHEVTSPQAFEGLRMNGRRVRHPERTELLVHPDGVEVASTNQARSWYRPWTYVVPLTNRLIAVDHRADRRHPERPDQVLTRVILAGRWEPTRQFGVVYDCRAHRRADLLDQVELDGSGELKNADWLQLPADDRVMRAACGD